MKLQSTIWTTCLNPLPGTVLDLPHINPHFSVCFRKDIQLWLEKKNSVFVGECLSLLSHTCNVSYRGLSSDLSQHPLCYVIRWVLPFLVPDLFNCWWSFECFLYFHFSTDSHWLERQELSEITFLNLFLACWPVPYHTFAVCNPLRLPSL